MVTLTESQRQAIETLGGEPVQLLDQQSQKVYYLISAEQFEQVRGLLRPDPFAPRELYPLIAKAAAAAGWADPQMDDYDRYDELRSPD